ncbi:MAG: hypothetical protein J0H00_09155 [Burkholderiales bacterium]|nr:hypothetical protein [Burkholderiales bacterium]OJX06759.1 MAG: hypothetical protein BGO72_00215 [Burkholderiales bacterium 70-64]
MGSPAGADRHARRAAGDAPSVPGEALSQAVRVVARLNAPWARLLESVESAGDAGVTLLAMEPDAQRGEVRIQAEAKDMQVLLGYVQRLGEAPALSGADLESHQVRLQDPQHPVSATIVARWRTRQAGAERGH